MSMIVICWIIATIVTAIIITLLLIDKKRIEKGKRSFFLEDEDEEK